MINEPDEVLYSRFLKEGNSDDLRVLLERYRESLTLFLYRYMDSMEDAEEIMLDSFAAAVSGTASFRGSSSFKTWLFAIGRNQAMKQLKKRRLETVPMHEGLAYDTEEPGMEIFRSEEREKLYKALEEIHPDYREALYLMYFENMSVDEIASVMNKNRKQIYNMIQRGRDSLKKTLERMGFDHDNY